MGTNNIYYAEIDQTTGQIGADPILVATNARSLGVTYNGPEFAVTSRGWFIFYTAQDGANSRIYKYDPWFRRFSCSCSY